MKAWFSFIIRYIITAIIGIIAVIILVPIIQAHKSEIDQFKESLSLDQLATMFDSFSSNDADEDLDVTESTIVKSYSTTPSSSQNNINTPSSNNSSGQNWGIIAMPKASYYTPKGKFLGHLPPGTALKIKKIESTAKGNIAVCVPVKTMSEPIILTHAKYLTIRRNDMSSISKELEKLYVQQAQLQAEVEAIKRQNSSSLRKDNPHAKEYASIKKRYHDYWREVKVLTKKRDTTTGQEHMDCADKLRMMKGEDIRIADSLKKHRANYKNWNKTHPRPANDNKEVNMLLTELDRLGKAISKKEKSG
ncbi:MAG: hypothetical protein KAI74_07455 [Kiritimatiellae bacterium]|nr:hypothetical protein [Kiritimatiellia bacterium]